MKRLMLITIIISMMTVIYRWRYKIMNTVLAITVIRKLIIGLSLKIPFFRSQMIRTIFKPSSHM